MKNRCKVGILLGIVVFTGILFVGDNNATSGCQVCQGIQSNDTSSQEAASSPFDLQAALKKVREARASGKSVKGVYAGFRVVPPKLPYTLNRKDEALYQDIRKKWAKKLVEEGYDESFAAHFYNRGHFLEEHHGVTVDQQNSEN